MRDLTRRWPASTIPFEIDPTLPVEHQQIVKDAVFFWNNTAGILLTPRSTQGDFVFYTADKSGESGGHSSVGRDTGRQVIRMDFGWSEAVGALLHETGHAAGLVHEHQRPDRDQFVFAPAQANDPSNGDLAINTTDIPIGPYDCRSVMQYYITTNDPNGFRTKAPGCWYPHHGIMLSPGDVRALQSLYWGSVWSDRKIAAHDVSVGTDGCVWIIGASAFGAGFQIFRWNGRAWHLLPGSAVRIGAASTTAAWCVNSAGAVFEWSEAQFSWIGRPGSATDIAMGADGSVWMTTTNAPFVNRWDGTTWQSPWPFPSPASRIAASSSGDAWVVTAGNEIFRWSGGTSWIQQPGEGHDIAVGADGTVGMTSKLGAVSFWSPERPQWVDIDSPTIKPGATSNLFEIAIAPNGLPWVVNAGSALLARMLAPEADVQLLNTIRGVLLVGGFRSFVQLATMSGDQQRNTLIVELGTRTKQPGGYFQTLDDTTLGGVGAVLVFIRMARIRTDADILGMTDDDLRNTLIVELSGWTGHSVPDLQGRTNLDLVLLGLGRDAAFIRGVLIAGGFRTYSQLIAASKPDQRNTLIVELAGRTKQTVGHFQAMDDATLGGVGAVLVFIRMAHIRTDAEIHAATDDDLRNTLIVEMAGLTGRNVPFLQGLKNLDLVQAGLTGNA
jgi:hypothetical protein